jgi:chromosome segregation ATPase
MDRATKERAKALGLEGFDKNPDPRKALDMALSHIESLNQSSAAKMREVKAALIDARNTCKTQETENKSLTAQVNKLMDDIKERDTTLVKLHGQFEHLNQLNTVRQQEDRREITRLRQAILAVSNMVQVLGDGLRPLEGADPRTVRGDTDEPSTSA